jgi:hypothetical protein
MKHLEVDWYHSIPNEPVKLYLELDDQMWEVRKVEVYSDGTAGYADAENGTRGTKLSIEPLPSMDDIASDPQFKPREISAHVFELVWKSFTSSRGHSTSG